MHVSIIHKCIHTCMHTSMSVYMHTCINVYITDTLHVYMDDRDMRRVNNCLVKQCLHMHQNGQSKERSYLLKAGEPHHSPMIVKR
jgi:hypothetical protein